MANTDGGTSLSPRQKCSICGANLSKYNRLGHCFHHLHESMEGLYQPKQEPQAPEASPVVIEKSLQPQPTPSKDTLVSMSALTPEIVMKAVCEEYAVSVEQLQEKNRQPRIVLARQVCMYLLYQDAPLSYPKIGSFIGGRDHTTVIHGAEKVAKELGINNSLQESVKRIRLRYLQKPPQ